MKWYATRWSASMRWDLHSRNPCMCEKVSISRRLGWHRQTLLRSMILCNELVLFCIPLRMDREKVQIEGLR
ncbi:hypothetical protein STCU_11876 [Strigomonas culicis]|uniref:Uncharacterized protein n=1 Tax=Strigomonas culicis TaxID=28005 RepID=S9TH40_9TRYP|nr:hypothetical protein STCU_11876 [Strigomonas culicis]|eukprot:EPY15633.1 hypothetical protein STCU_11876 [Strigomonas culicis]